MSWLGVGCSVERGLARAAAASVLLVACGAGPVASSEPAPAAAPAAEPSAEPAGESLARSAAGLEQIALVVGESPVVAEVADTPPLRSQGLMNRPSMAPGHGMVFVYPDERPRSFWMKNTLLPLSIAYIDQRGVIVHMADMMPLDESPVPSMQPAMYALEMPQGWFDSHGVAVGMSVQGLPGASQE